VRYHLDEGEKTYHFVDDPPYGSLDEVILDNKIFGRELIHPSDPEFEKYQTIWQEKIKPLYLEENCGGK